jgi:hypothetical protein
MQFWCPAPLPRGEEPRRKLRSNKYQLPAAQLLENYEFDSSVEADEETNTEVGDDSGTHPEASCAVKPRHTTRAVAAKRSASMATAKDVASRTTKLEAGKKKRKRKTSPPPVAETPIIPTRPSREVESDEEEEDEGIDDPLVVEERSVKRSLSPAAKRQHELGQKVMEDDLRQGLEAQRAATAAAAAQARIPVQIKACTFRTKLCVPTTARYGHKIEGLLVD